ncbi:small molecule-binding protein [Allofranklinella schreckenbergeri]|uniref:Small molecule-binding protein n=1 Tax=Allofranklinella schreckenbergeri TaxID=1076744 RepID=A0A3M6R456_9BURK|nr:GyrI-like domain-containing protein [Allofranklinella schreckenbergeri]MDO4704877.1 GyrI-like domain-containing protein [Comamonadaceae bacterium]RMX09991.1 small molecule-binding protein [Allofranklinella schreckenbergeri]
MKHEWKKSEKNLYGAKPKPELIDVPSQNFIVIKGKGNPNGADFSNRVSALYSLAYAIKMRFKAMMKTESDDKMTDFSVYPLEGVWQKPIAESEKLDKDTLQYTLAIKQPDCITREIFTDALESARKKKPNDLYDAIGFESMKDGKSVQILHAGSYDNEPASFEKMDAFTKSLGLVRCSPSHREIYLNNASRTAQNKLKTILRYSVK